jgi:hypothetical protein
VSAAHLAGFYRQQTFAGNTNPTIAEPTAAAPSLTEAFHSSALVSELDTMFSGGLHPETFLQPASRDLEAATTSIRGAHGGVTPRLGSPLQPGPAGAAAAAGRGAWARLTGR